MSPGPEIQSGWWMKGTSAASPPKSESFITLSRQEQSRGKIKLTKTAMFVKAGTLSHIFTIFFVIPKKQCCKCCDFTVSE